MKSLARPSLRAKICLALAASLGTVLILEVAFRYIDYDFERTIESFRAMPVYFQQPIVPVGEIYFRRSGPAKWTGKPLSTRLKLAGGLDQVYTNETEVTISYDKDGFRNPDNLADWEVVVVGDSFVELGYLPYEDLHTTRLGKLLGVQVKNLGVSYTGPLTYLHYLNQYGKSSSSKHAVMVFFEGNDLLDLQREDQWLQTFTATGRRPTRNFENQPSLTRAVYRSLKRLVKGTNSKPKLIRNAFFTSREGKVPVSVVYAPPGKNEMPVEQRMLLDSALAEWSRTARKLGMRPWLVYMPCKRRVLDGYLKFADNAPPFVANWRPSDLPAFVKELSEKNTLGFIDSTPALTEQTRQGKLTYNPVDDTHLNREGCLVVARVVADALKAAPN